MKLSQSLLFCLFAILVCFSGFSMAEVIPIPGGSGGGTSNITSTITAKAAIAKTVFGVIIGLVGLISAGVGTFYYTLRKWDKGNSWMIGAGVGLVAGSLITAYAQLWGG